MFIIGVIVKNTPRTYLLIKDSLTIILPLLHMATMFSLAHLLKNIFHSDKE